jgi:arylamine N-acetyltransferase
MSNWFTSTHPRSPFVTALIVSSQRDDGSWFSLSNRNGLEFTEQSPTQTSVTPVEPDAVPGLLATRFALPGFSLGPEGHLVAAVDG